MVDKIKLHRRIGKIIFTDLLHSTLSNDKLQTNLAKLEHQLKQEKTINKSWQVQIKEYKQKLMNLGDDPNNSEFVKNFLKEKET